MRWAEIDGYAYPYRISTDGTVQKKMGEKWITLAVSTDNGRAEVKLRRVNGTQRKVGVLRLMDRIFCDGYADKNNLRVTPKNGMKTDCALENLGYATQNEIGRAALRRTARKPVARTDRNGVVSVYKSLKEAAQKSGLTVSSLERRIKGEVFDPRGYKWEVLK